MRKLLILSALSILCANAQSVQQSCQPIGASNIYVISVNWTASSSGSVPQTLLQCPIMPTIQGYRVVNSEATPGSTAPTNGYSITLLDSSGVDIMASAMSALSSTSPASFQASPTAPPIFGALNFTLTGNSVNSATGRILIYFAPLQQIVGLSPTTPSFPAQGADLFYASPCGSSGSPGFRALCTSDFSASLIPPSSLNAGINLAATGGGGVTGTLPGTNMSAVNLAASGNGGVTGIAPSVNGGSGVASPTAHTVPVAEGSSPFNFVGPGTAGQVLTSNGAGSDPSWQGSQLPSGSQTQYLQLTPNSTNTAYRFNSIGYANVLDYNFPAQAPGGSLTSNTQATVTLNPCPLGVNGTNVFYQVYISGGTGTAEVVTVTGGSCTGSGTNNGTIIFTPGNSHSGAWTISSATNGAAEAAWAVPGGMIFFPGNTTYLFYGTLTLFPPSTAQMMTCGGWDAVLQTQSATTNIVQLYSNNPAIVQNCGFDSSPTRTAGAAVQVGDGVNYNSFGSRITQNFFSSKMFNGIYVASGGDVGIELNQINAINYGISLTNLVNADQGDDGIINNIILGTPATQAGIYVDNLGGVRAVGNKIVINSTYGIDVEGRFYAIFIANNSIEAYENTGVRLNCTVAGCAAQVSGNEIESQGVQIGPCVYAAGTSSSLLAQTIVSDNVCAGGNILVGNYVYGSSFGRNVISNFQSTANAAIDTSLDTYVLGQVTVNDNVIFGTTKPSYDLSTETMVTDHLGYNNGGGSGTTFTALPTPAAGSQLLVYGVTASSSPCTSGSATSLATYVHGAWVCD